MNGEVLSFSLFSVLAVGGAGLALFSKSAVRSAFALLASFLGVAGLYLVLGADFLAVTQILLYAGGILVLYLFGLMLVPPEGDAPKALRRPLALILAAAPVTVLLIGFLSRSSHGSPAVLAEPTETVKEIGLALLRPDGWLLPFEYASILLLAALVGAVHLARRSASNEEAE